MGVYRFWTPPQGSLVSKLCVSPRPNSQSLSLGLVFFLAQCSDVLKCQCTEEEKTEESLFTVVIWLMQDLDYPERLTKLCSYGFFNPNPPFR